MYVKVIFVKVFFANLNRFYNFAKGAACKQRRLTPPDTGPVPPWDLHAFQCWDKSLLNLSCFRIFEFWTSLGTSILLLKVDTTRFRIQKWNCTLHDKIIAFKSYIQMKLEQLVRSPHWCLFLNFSYNHVHFLQKIDFEVK